MIDTFQFIIFWLSPNHPLTNVKAKIYKTIILPVVLHWRADWSQWTGVSDGAPNLYSEDVWFESAPGDWLSWGFNWFCSVCSGNCLSITSISPLPRRSKSFPIHQSFYYSTIYRLSQKERSIFREVTVSVILSKNVYMYMYPIPNSYRDRAITLYRTVHCTEEQHAMSSRELQSPLMLTVEFSKMYYTR
jgi:hypothetical protein